MAMKIVTIVRARNEERNIERFIRCYQDWVDLILVADGGSEDRTVEIASQFDKVKVRAFDELVEYGKIWRNPGGRHINFLIDWAEQEENADWLILDDCDCFPTQALQTDGRHLIETSPHNYIYFNRLYIYHKTHYFPRLNKAGTSLWSWRAGLLKADEVVFAAGFSSLREVRKESRLELAFPYAGLHCFAPDDEEIERKLRFYRDSGFSPNMLHPLKFGGPLEPLPDWAIS